MDIMLSLIGLIVLSPLLIVLVILVKTKLGAPIIFKQNRIGRNEKVFKLYKFRSMTNQKDQNGELLPDNLRLTKFGKFLRSTSLDELPELFNIFIGNMSIVGPRPLVLQYLQYFNETERERHQVRPGLTGNAQVNGRNAIKWEERFLLDVKYVQNLSFINDLKILIKTIKTVVNRENIGERNKNVAIDFDKYRIEQRRNQNESKG